jgi:hypothetical protein
MQLVHVAAPDAFFGQIVDLEIEAGFANSLAARPLTDVSSGFAERIPV